jgi:hypothetical protein
VIMHAIATAMEAEDVHIANALSGVDGDTATLNISRQEPVALFFVIYGLAFEALVTPADEATLTLPARQAVKIALQLLRHLVQPQYSGTSFAAGPLFDELVALAYRMAMTEPADVQNDFIDVVTNTIKSRAQQLSRYSLPRSVWFRLNINRLVTWETLSQQACHKFSVPASSRLFYVKLFRAAKEEIPVRMLKCAKAKCDLHA